MVESPDNRARGEKWEPASPAAYYYWQRVPRPTAGPMPLVVLSMNAFYHHAFGLDLRRFYTDPQTYLKGYLAACLNKFRWFQDDTYFLPEVPIWLGPSFEPNLFGKKVLYSDDKDPWIGQEPVLRARQDLDRLEPPDFRRSGLMPVVHRMYEEIGELVAGRLKVRFTNWLRGPFVLAFHLRGAANILMDMVDDPAYVHRLMRFVTDARKRWSTRESGVPGGGHRPGGSVQRRSQCAAALTEATIANSSCRMRSNSVSSTGKSVTGIVAETQVPLAEVIRTIPHLNMINISGWTDFDRAAGCLCWHGPSS